MPLPPPLSNLPSQWVRYHCLDLAGMFGAARYGKGHNIASMDCVVASLAMGRIQQAFLTKAIRQSKKHHTAAERERECKAAARARAVRPGKESGTKDSPVPTSESGDDMEDDDDDDDDDYSDDLDDGSDDDHQGGG